MASTKKVSYITINGARKHNLKNVTVKIPRNQFTVVTGVSGSGKSSLAFDTLYAEGQRRYVESLSSYARQFLGRLEKPEVDSITGLSPAIAIEQKVSSKNTRSTVGTSTEIFEYLKLLYARIGKTISPISGNEVKRHNSEDVLTCVSNQKNATTVIILSPIDLSLRSAFEQAKIYQQQGFSRLYIKDQGFKRIEDLEEKEIAKLDANQIKLAIDRITIGGTSFEENRFNDGVNTAFYEGNGSCEILFQLEDGSEVSHHFSNKFELDGITFEEPSEALFSFNNPYGACKKCEGFGSIIGIDPDLVIPNNTLSLYADAIVCWKGEKMSKWKDDVIANASKCNFPIHRPINELSPEEYKTLWNGNKHFKGIHQFFAYLEEKSYKIQYRVMLSRYRGKTACDACEGSRIRKDAGYVKVANTSIFEILRMPIRKANAFFETINLTEFELQVADRILLEIKSRLHFLMQVGLGYLTLDRVASTLSGGESQRINLATSLGSSLVGSTYILDEPSIGLHPEDTKNLITVLKGLQKIGNTVVVVEHDKEIMLQADYLVDMGPMAGSNGGEVCFQGDLKSLKTANTLTSRFLFEENQLEDISTEKIGNNYIEIIGARANNLKNIDVRFPLGVFSVVTGVSGSGKSTLIKDILFPGLLQKLNIGGVKPAAHTDITGALKSINSVEYIDQNPIGKSSRSNPVTYVKAYDEIRALFAALPFAKQNGLKPAHFSFNVPSGRCDACEGEGTIKVEMQFMADVYLTCEDCKGKRFKDDILEAKFNGASIHDVLEMTIDNAIEFFQKGTDNTCKKTVNKLLPLQQVGLGYLKLGQASNTLSGGEAQRIKLASFIGKGQRQDPILFLFDEPTTGLHYYDINNLLKAFELLMKVGHTIICIEHNTDLIAKANYIVDIGPEGGENGGNLVFQGPIKDILKEKKSLTAKYLV